jgi:flagellar biosynthesis/type III secretory pathway M-ring protein FliF/YscJ
MTNTLTDWVVAAISIAAGITVIVGFILIVIRNARLERAERDAKAEQTRAS